MKINLNWLKNFKESELNSLGEDPMKDILVQARDLFKKRSEQFEKNPQVYSYSYETIIKKYDKGMFGKPINHIGRSKAYNEIVSLKHFFNSEGSTVKGARRIATEQDIRIFGLSEQGLKAGRRVGAGRLTRKEREYFWEVYNEYENTYKSSKSSYVSGDRQQVLADMFRANRHGELSKIDLMKELDAILKEVKEAEKIQREDLSNEVLFGSNKKVELTTSEKRALRRELVEKAVKKRRRNK